MRALAPIIWLAVVASPLAIASACATNDDTPANEDLPDAQTIPETDAGPRPDACVDGNAACAAALDCTRVDFCATPFPVSRLVALNAIWGSGPTDVWTVGTGGTILHGDGTSFVPVAADANGSTDIYVSVWGTSKSDIWIIGPRYPLHIDGFQNGKPVVEPRPGSTWSAAGAASGRLWTGVAAGAQVWIGGEESSRFGLPRSSFWSLAADGDGGTAWSGGAACLVDQPCSPAVRGAWAADDFRFWAVGRDGQAFTLDTKAGPARWLGQNTNTRNDLEGVWGSSASDVWAVGQHGTLRHGSSGSATWSVIASPTTNDLHAVWGSAANDVWAVGDAGTIVHFDGKAWTLASLGLPDGDTRPICSASGAAARRRLDRG